MPRPLKLLTVNEQLTLLNRMVHQSRHPDSQIVSLKRAVKIREHLLAAIKELQEEIR